MNENEPVSFPDWKAALARAALSDEIKAAYTREILTFLKHCRVEATYRLRHAAHAA